MKAPMNFNIRANKGNRMNDITGQSNSPQQLLISSSLSMRSLLFGLLIVAAIHSAASAEAPQLPKQATVARDYGHLPLRFEASPAPSSDAQAVQFSARGAGYALSLSHQEAALALRSSVSGQPADVIRMQLRDSNPHARIEGLEKLSGSSNYLLGNDPGQWRTNVPAYARVQYTGVYEGIDLVYYGNQGQLEYDFIVAPHADPKPIRFNFAGAQSLSLDASGDLVIQGVSGQAAFHKPVVYQLKGGQRYPVKGRFQLLADNSVGFTLGRYDHAQPLVIDPTLVYSTYLGGTNSDTMNAIAVDSSGNAYITGTTASTDYPVTTGAFQTKFSTAFVTKLNATGTAVLYSTFLGGSGSSSGGDTAWAIAVDSAGDAYVGGSTFSKDFPVSTGALQTTNKTGAGSSTAFVSKLNPAGTALLYSTYLGGTRTDTAYSLVIDAAGNAYIGGAAYSGDFPVTTGVFQSTNKSFSSYGWNEFVTKLNPAGSALLYSTYIGGSGNYGSPTTVRLAIDAAGDAFVASTVLSTDFPVTTGAYQITNKATGRGNMTLAKLNPTATKLTYATYLGGASSPYGDDIPFGLAVDTAGNAYLSGTTWETNYPTTTGALQTTNKTGGNGLSAGFVTKMNPAGSALVFSSYLSGTGSDRTTALAIDSSGDVFLTGSVHSTDFPVTTGAFQATNPAGNHGAVVFLSELNPAGSALLYSTYFGGANSFSDTGLGIALGANGTVYLTGTTGASNFPTTPAAYKTVFNSTNLTTGFVSEFTFGTVVKTTPTGTTLTSNANPAATGSNVTFTAAVVPTTGTGIPTGSVVFSVDLVTVATIPLNGSGFAAFTTSTPLALGTHNILASYQGSSTYGASGGNLSESITPASPVISPASGVHSAAFLVTLADSTAGSVLYYTLNGSLPTASSTKYVAPFLVSSNVSVNAIAIVTGKPGSKIVRANYTVISSPYALAVPPTLITTSGATLNGLVNPYGMAGSYLFHYGTSATALTRSTVKTALPSGGIGGLINIAPIPVSATIIGLTTKTTYYFQVVVTTPAGTSSGEVLSFTTN